MSELIHFEIKELPALKLVGKELRYSRNALMQGDNRIPGLWDQCYAENAFAVLEAQTDCVFDAAHVGVMIDWDRGDGDFSYICGMLMRDDAVVPEGYVSRMLVPTKAAVSWIRGKDVADVCAKAHELTEQALQAEGYRNDGMSWCMELYNCPRFTTPDEKGQITLDYYIPVAG